MKNNNQFFNEVNREKVLNSQSASGICLVPSSQLGKRSISSLKYEVDSPTQKHHPEA